MTPGSSISATIRIGRCTSSTPADQPRSRARENDCFGWRRAKAAVSRGCKVHPATNQRVLSGKAIGSFGVEAPIRSSPQVETSSRLKSKRGFPYGVANEHHFGFS
jgi:hypothetical protein